LRPSTTPRALAAARPRFDALANEIPLKFCKPCHDRAHQLAAGGAEVEAETA
jgi:hypothetical protein